jgi:hypothetical protein
MTDNEKTRLKNAEANVKTLEKRIIRLEEEMALCLRFMRIQAEKMAKEKDPTFKVHESFES